MPTVRLLSYNIRSLRDNARAVVRVILEARPDIVCIQEAPRFVLWRTRCRFLAYRCRLRWIAGGRDAGANLILVRRGVRRLGRHDVTFSLDRGLHVRGAAIAVLAFGGGRLVVAGTHLDLMAAPRLRHASELAAALAKAAGGGVPVIVAGDINEGPDGPAWTAMTELGVDAFHEAGVDRAWTYPAVKPVKQIDGVFVSRPATVRKAEVPDNADVRIASDHRPVLVEVSVP
jgi:endonuclease/exonuclease/phosphatase family metal-dependent hydrolase